MEFYTKEQYNIIERFKHRGGAIVDYSNQYLFYFVDENTTYDVRARTLGPAGWSEQGNCVSVQTPLIREWLSEMSASGKLAALAQVNIESAGDVPQQIAVETIADESVADGHNMFTLRVRIGEYDEENKFISWCRRDVENVKLDSKTGSVTIELEDVERYVYTETAYGLDMKSVGGKLTLKFSVDGISGTWAGSEFSGSLYLRRNDCDGKEDCGEEIMGEYVPFVTEQTYGAVADIEFDGNGGAVSTYLKRVLIGCEIGALPKALDDDYGDFVLDGWWTEKEGGIRITALTIVTAPATYYAHWRLKGSPIEPPADPILAPVGEPTNGVPTNVLTLFAAGAAETAFTGDVTYNGWVRNADGTLAGLLTVKAGKAAKPEKGGQSKLTVTYTPFGGKKQTIKLSNDAMPVAGEVATVALPGVGTVKFTGDAIVGVDVDVQAAKDALKSKDKAEKAAATAAAASKAGVWTFALGTDAGYAAFTATVDKKGKGKLAGTLPDGTKVSVSAQGILGDGVLAIPFAYAKKGSLGFVFWVTGDGTAALSDLTGVGAASVIAPSASLRLVDGEHVFTAGGVSQGFAVAGKKWNVPKQNKRAEVDPNPTGLKLAFTEKTGAVKGAFTVADGKAKTKYTVVGVVVGGKLYGAAYARNVGSMPATAE